MAETWEALSELDKGEEAAVDLSAKPASDAASEKKIPPKPSKLSPQANVDRFWRKFTTKHPGKVRSILPSDVYARRKELTSATDPSIYSNKAFKSYKQAAAECTKAVEKIARECRRVNAKYRDQHFDIEFDLKRWPFPRNCLDGLGYNCLDHSPKSVKRVTDIFKNPQFYLDEATANDVRQGFGGDCWFLSAVCAISNKRHLIDRVCVAKDEVVGVYGFVFHRDGEWFHTVIDDKLYLTAADWWETHDEEKGTFEAINRQEAEDEYQKALQTGSKALYFAQCREENETWLPLLEKAFAKAHGDYSAIDGGFTGEAIEDLTGGVTTELFTTDILDKETFWKEEMLKVNDKFLFSCATGAFDKWQDSDTAERPNARSGIIRLHAYSIMDAVEKKGLRLLKVRNPWGTDEWRGAWSDGSEQWTPEWMHELNHRFGDDGMFWISYEDLLKKYSNFERTRLFDESWITSQQWTTVDVSWSADYNDTKFSITLTKETPIVIVLSQLDDRYFRGLEGVYTFQLHYRIDKEGEDDYIVRSHGNYAMRRSVSTDLHLEAGSYSVLMRITARRISWNLPPEKVVRDVCQDRPEKLIQTGLSYDLAHAKGVVVESAEEKAYKKQDKKKQKETDRKKQRKEISKKQRKTWEYNKRLKAREKRHTVKREAYEKKLADKKAEEARQAGVTSKVDAPEVKDQAGSTDVGSGIEAKEETKPIATDSVSASEGQTTAGANEASSASEQQKTQPEESAEGKMADKNAPTQIPTVTVNSAAVESGTPAAPAADQAPPTASHPTALAPNPPPSPALSAASGPPTGPAAEPPESPNDDYLYDSDASFHSSIDSVLDFPAADTDDDEDEEEKDKADGITSPDNNDNDGDQDDDSDNDDEEDKEIASDPWNAVCVVGLRVYSHDAGCKISAVRPRPKEKDAGLEVDDVSKGVSAEAKERKT